MRFVDNNNGTVTDNETGLIWLRDAGALRVMPWQRAMDACAELSDGQHGLTDGSLPGDWRLPSVKELVGLLDYECQNPALSEDAGSTFSRVRSNDYWSSSSYAGRPLYAWYVYFGGGYVAAFEKSRGYYVWPVRGGGGRVEGSRDEEVARRARIAQNMREEAAYAVAERKRYWRCCTDRDILRARVAELERRLASWQRVVGLALCLAGTRSDEPLWQHLATDLARVAGSIPLQDRPEMEEVI